MPVYHWCDERFAWVDKDTGERMDIPDREPQAPRVWSDLPGYRSPVDGTWIEGRRARRYDLEKNNCVPYEPSMSKANPDRFGEKKRKARDEAGRA